MNDAATRTIRSAVPIPAALAVLLGGSVYVSGLNNPFVYNDARTVVDNASLTRLWDIRAIVMHDVSRPLTNLSYALDHGIWGDGPWGFHFTSLLLHLLNVVLLYVLARRLASDRDTSRAQAGALAFITAALFAVHPMMSQAVLYVSARADLLSATWILLTCLAARAWMRGGGGRRLAATWCCWILGLLTKETAVVVPLLLIAYDVLLMPAVPTARLERVRLLHAPLLLVAALGGLARLVVLFALETAHRATAPGSAILDVGIVTWRYVGLLLVPIGLSIHHELDPAASLLDPRGTTAIAGIVGVAAVAWHWRRSSPLATFGLVWFLLLLLPGLAVVLTAETEPLAENRAYLASAGLFLVAALGAGRLAAVFAGSRLLIGLGASAMAAGTLALGAQTLVRTAIWASPVALAREAAELAPAAALPRMVLGESLYQEGRFDEAASEFEEAIRLEPDTAINYFKLSMSQASVGHADAARHTIARLREIHPHSLLASLSDGVVSAIAGDPIEARRSFDDVLAREPDNVTAREWLAALDEAAGNSAEAARLCREIELLEPGKRTTAECIARNEQPQSGP